MIVKVIKDYFDKSDKKKLKTKGSIIEYNDDRALELISLGVAEEVEIEVLKKETKKATSK